MEIKTELKVLKALSKIFTEAENPSTKYTDKSVTVAQIDSANVVLFEAKNADGRRLLSRFIEADADPVKVPELEYSEKNQGSCKYSSDYLQSIIAVLSLLNESIKFEGGYDYPATIENDYFKFILAPRVESD